MSDKTYVKFDSEEDRDEALKIIGDENVKGSYTHKDQLYFDGSLKDPEKTGETIKLLKGKFDK